MNRTSLSRRILQVVVGVCSVQALVGGGLFSPGAMVAELVLPPILVLWQRSVARARAR